MDETVPSLVLLAAAAEVLTLQTERLEHAHLVTDTLRAELRALSSCVETELESVANRRHLHLADESGSVSDPPP